MKFLTVLLFLPFFVFSQQNYPYKNLVFKGGGIRGLAYAGALKVLEEKGVLKNIENVAGSSAGAIAALMVALGYNSHEIDSILDELKIQQFNDGKNIVGKINRFKNEYGIFKGEKFESWLSKLIKNKTGNSNTTFAELHQLHINNNTYKDLYCTGTNISRQQLEIFSWQQTPSMQLKTAVHISGCIPIYFTPVAIDSLWQEVSIQKNTHYNLYVDGGMLCNYPINMFDTCVNGNNPLMCDSVKYNHETLGLKLERPEQINQFDSAETGIAPFEISSMKDYMMALMNLMMETLNRKTPGLENEIGRTIYISYGNIFGRPRKVSGAEKKELFDNGAEAAEKFFKESAK
ncbi:MAG: patatin-like phospholipase family protein [Chitinophagaceae bacterium]